MQKIKLLVPIFFVTLALSLCTPPHALYLRNFLATEITVTMRFKDKEQLDKWTYYDKEKLAMRKNVSSFNKTGNRLFKDTVSGRMIGPLTIEYRIPGKSVVEFGNAWTFSFDKIDLAGEQFNKTFFLQAGI